MEAGNYQGRSLRYSDRGDVWGGADVASLDDSECPVSNNKRVSTYLEYSAKSIEYGDGLLEMLMSAVDVLTDVVVKKSMSTGMYSAVLHITLAAATALPPHAQLAPRPAQI